MYTFLQLKSNRGQYGGRTCGRGTSGMGQRSTLPPLGYCGGATPFHIKIPKEPYYAGHQ
jgi:large subunit ribosomal protein L15